MSLSNQNRAKLAGEFAVIVIGVLVALWIDAGWNWMQDRQDEQVLLMDLRADFEENYTRVQETIESHRLSRETGARFVRGGVDAFSADSLNEMGRRLVTLETFNPRMGALESAISSGHIDLLRDDDLRAALAAWSGYVTDAVEEVEWAVPTNIRLVEPTAAKWVRGEPPLIVWSQLEEDPEWLNLLGLKIIALTAAQEDSEALLAQTERILAILRAATDQ